jgi:delta 1-pyrroline-5-carboxylate dehydrogenase
MPGQHWIAPFGEVEPKRPLHVVRWKSDELDDVIDAVNETGSG